MKVVKSKDPSNDAVSYFGPTYTVIRSPKHSGLSAFYHFHDMNSVHSLPELTNSFQDQHSKEKSL